MEGGTWKYCKCYEKLGMLFMTTDHFCIIKSGLPQRFCALHEQAIAKESSPFFSPFIVLFDKAVADKQKGCQVRNLECLPFLQPGVEYIPGAEYQYSQLNIGQFRRMLQPMGHPQPIQIFLRGTTSSISITDVIQYLGEDQLAVQLGNYAFDAERLEKAVRLFVPADRLRTLRLSWTSEFSQAAAAAGPSTVGLTFMKQ